MNDGGKRKYTDEIILAAFSNSESSETTRQTSLAISAREDDIVRSAWRHAEESRNDSPSG